MDNISQNPKTPVNPTVNASNPPIKTHYKKLPIIVISIFCAVLFLAIIAYFVFFNQSSDSSQSPLSIIQKQVPIKGCGNKVCEGGETFESCPSDCTQPNSIEPYIATTNLSVADFPPAPKDTQWSTPRDTHWSKFLDNDTITVEGGYLPPAFNNFKLLYGKQTAIRIAEYGDTQDVEIAMDDLARIDQYVLVYSPNDIEKVLAATTKSIFSLPSAGAASQDLPDPGIGDKSKAFKFYFPDNKHRYVIVFIKKPYFEMIMLSGTAFEYKVLEDVARKAADKIQISL